MHVPIFSMTLISVLHGYGDKAVRGRAVIFVGHPSVARSSHLYCACLVAAWRYTRVSEPSESLQLGLLGMISSYIYGYDLQDTGQYDRSEIRHSKISVPRPLRAGMPSACTL